MVWTHEIGCDLREVQVGHGSKLRRICVCNVLRKIETQNGDGIPLESPKAQKNNEQLKKKQDWSIFRRSQIGLTNGKLASWRCKYIKWFMCELAFWKWF